MLTDYWLITSVLISGIIIIYRNKLDLLLVFYLSNLLYHHGIIFNYIYTGSFNDTPNEEAKRIVAVLFSSLLFVKLLEGALPRKHTETISYSCHVLGVKSSKIFQIFLYISLLSTLIFLVSAGSDIFANKANSKNSAVPYSFVGSYYFAYACSGYFLLNKNYTAFSLTALIIVLYVFVGTRAFFVLYIINIVILMSESNNLFSRKNYRMIIFVTVTFVALAVYKHFYIALKALNFNEIVDIWSDLDFSKLMWMLFSAEWSQISMNTYRVTLLGDSALYSFWDMLVMNLPGFESWSNLPERFSEVIYFNANPGYSYGLGGAFWAEIWYAFGLLGVFIVSQFILWYLVYCNFLLYSRIGLYLLHAPLATFIAFYLPRNDFSMLFASVKNLLISIALGIIIAMILPWQTDSGGAKIDT